MYRIMTVCTGNICRSPVGEYLIRQHAQEAGVPVTVTSSGISNEEEGNRIDPSQCRPKNHPKHPPRPTTRYPTDTLEPCTES